MFLSFLDGIDRDLREGFLQRLRARWTHTSTALEGNQLTEGETHFVLSEGLTISGKPLRDHNEVVGHGSAIELLYTICRDEREIKEEDLFALHEAVQTRQIIDIFQPTGAWKVEENSTTIKMDDEIVENATYAPPRDVPVLMEDWLSLLNSYLGKNLEEEEAIVAYAEVHAAFVRIHPFADGNGRIARLVSNLPLLCSGYPPLVISQRERSSYLEILGLWQITGGRARKDKDLLPERELLEVFVDFCRSCYSEATELLEETLQSQKLRDAESP